MIRCWMAPQKQALVSWMFQMWQERAIVNRRLHHTRNHCEKSRSPRDDCCVDAHCLISTCSTTTFHWREVCFSTFPHMFSSQKDRFRCKLLRDKPALQFESTKGPPEFPGLMAVSVLRSSIGGEGSPSYLVALNTIICASTSKPRTARCCPCCNIKTMSYESPPEKRKKKTNLNLFKSDSFLPNNLAGKILQPSCDQSSRLWSQGATQCWHHTGTDRVRIAWGGYEARPRGATKLMKIEVMTQGISNGHHQLPHTQFRGITQLHGRKWPGTYCEKTVSPYSPLNKPKNSVQCFPQHVQKSSTTRILNTSAAQTPNPNVFCWSWSWNENCQPATRGNSQNPNICGGITTNQLCLEHCVLITREFVIENSSICIYMIYVYMLYYIQRTICNIQYHIFVYRIRCLVYDT